VDVQGIIITGRRMVENQRLTVPDPNESDFVIQVEYCGLCTPEQRVYRGAKPTYPYWGGHELSGLVVAVSHGLRTPIHVGDRVAVLLMQRCGRCHACRRGLDNHCAYMHPLDAVGVPAGPGGLRDYVAVPAYKVFSVPVDLPPHMGALIEPVACVARSVQRANAKNEDFVAVVGGGTMGIIHTALLAAKGCRVHLFDDDALTHQAASAAGAHCVGPISQLCDPERVKQWTDGWGFDHVFCTRGGIGGIQSALNAVARGGCVVLFQSIPQIDLIALAANSLHYREIQIIGTVAQSARDIAAAIKILGSNHAWLHALKTEIFPASRPQDAFERALDSRVNRVIIDLRKSFVI
jgi:L-iditol 2-dehydrogenase